MTWKNQFVRKMLVAMLCMATQFGWARAQEASFESKAPQAILMDAATGEVLYEKDADRAVPPASMSKLMTQAVIFDMLKEGTLSEAKTFVVSRDAALRGGFASGASNMGANPNSQISVIDLLRGAIVQSANDACIVLAEGVAGSEPAFVAMMNAKAKKLDLKSSVFGNATGLPDPTHVMSMRDLAKLARYIQETHPDYYKIYSERSFTWNKQQQNNRNPLLTDYPGADGMKTGYTKEAGYGLVGSALRDGRRLIMVVSGLKSVQDRKVEASKLMDWGFRQYKPITVFETGDVVSKARVWGGETKSVELVVQKDFKIALSPAEQTTANISLNYNAPLLAPVPLNKRVGTVRVTASGRLIAEEDVYTAAEIKPVTSIWQRAADSVLLMVFGG
jgi:serine-type D-Ala-D-Ala carboxypeptidase (penicillin-binding protein 5/6)